VTKFLYIIYVFLAGETRLVPMTAAGHGGFIFKIHRSHHTNAEKTTTTTATAKSNRHCASAHVSAVRNPQFRTLPQPDARPCPSHTTHTRLHERKNANRVRVTSRRGQKTGRDQQLSAYQEKTKRIKTLQRYKCVRVCACTAETNRRWLYMASTTTTTVHTTITNTTTTITITNEQSRLVTRRVMMSCVHSV